MGTMDKAYVDFDALQDATERDLLCNEGEGYHEV